MPPLISAEAVFGAGVLMLAIGAGVALWCAGWAIWRVARWIVTGRL